jgi:predicted lipoprotein with Yx(FWY)xxD motif
MRTNSVIVGSLFIVAALIAGCSSSGSSAAATQAGAASQAPAASGAPASAGASVDASAATVEAIPVGTIGTVLVAANGMTVYTFTKDTKDSGKSVCKDACLTKWPALTVAAGGSPTAGAGVTGKLGTITRDDNGAIQVTYNGLPLYFFSNDKVPGDAAGVYTNWEAVKP